MISLLAIFGIGSGADDGRTNTVGGVDAVGEALAARGMDDYAPDIYFEEPRLVDRADGPITDLYVVIPTETASGSPEPGNLEFELPEDPNDDGEDLNAFLDALGVDGIEGVEGTTVEGEQFNGVLLPAIEMVSATDVTSSK